MIQAKIVAGSKNPFNDKKLVTFQLRYPRIIHAEMLTHSMLVRNSASSRAIPVSKMIEHVKKNMFVPLGVQKSHKGMQGLDYFTGKELEQVTQAWIESAELAIQQAEKMEKMGVTKQLCNRLLEPFEYIDVVISGTEWENFFSLRAPQYKYSYDGKTYRSKKDYLENCRLVKFDTKDPIEWLKINESQAEIHIQAIAEKMWDLYNEYDFKMLEPGDYHLPFIEIEEDTFLLK